MYTDAQLALLAQDVLDAIKQEQAAKQVLIDARKLLASAIGRGQTVVIKGHAVRVNDGDDDLTITPLRVVQ